MNRKPFEDETADMLSDTWPTAAVYLILMLLLAIRSFNARDL